VLSVAPLWPQRVHRARPRSTSLDAPAPQRITATADASGARCWQRSQFSHSHGGVQVAEPGGRALDLVAETEKDALAAFDIFVETSRALLVGARYWDDPVSRPCRRRTERACVSQWGIYPRWQRDDVTRHVSASEYLPFRPGFGP
jgi:hypothetical protein